jgi:hypothetical protein
MKEEAGFNTIILLIERKGFSMSNGIARNTPDTIQIANDAREICPYVVYDNMFLINLNSF